MESPAGKAGLQRRDYILQVDGKTPKGFIDLNRELLAAKDQNGYPLAVQRGIRQTLDFA